MRPFRAMPAVLALLAIAACIAARADDKAVKLARTFKKGDVSRMKIETTVDANGTDVLVSLTSMATVKEVKDNGQVVIAFQDEAGKVTANGSDMDIPAGPPTTVTFDKTGRLVDLKANEGAGILTLEILRLLETMRMPILPDKEVKAGDTWESEFENPAVKGKKFTVKTIYSGMEKVDGGDLWKIKQSGEPETDAAGAKMGYDATYWLDPSNGQIVKTDVKIKDQPTKRYGPHSLRTKTTRIRADPR